MELVKGILSRKATSRMKMKMEREREEGMGIERGIAVGSSGNWFDSGGR